MKNREILEKTQSVFYRIISRSFAAHKPSHAYLLVGDQTERATLFLAQSMICQQDDLACEECEDCRRIADGNFPDLITYDGLEKSIKKENIEYIQNEFNKSSLEGKGKIYILKNVEKSSDSAMNSLLKFLEEPLDGVYAILTTKNITKVLPTIQSRCQVIHLLPESKESIRMNLASEGITDEDARILSQLFGSEKKCLANQDSEVYRDVKVYALNFIEDLYTNPSNLLINLEISLMKKYKGEKETIRMFLNMVVLGLRDLFHVKHSMSITFVNHIDFLKRFQDDPHLLEKIELLLDTIYTIDTNANLALLLESMVYKLMKGV